MKIIAGAGIKNPEKYYSTVFFSSIVISIFFSAALFFFNFNPILAFFIVFILLQLFFYFKNSLKANSRVKKMETMFPDVIQLMSSNLRAGMTIDRAFLLSARPEFFPLDDEIMKAGKEIATGKDIAFALMNMSKRIGSEKISKTIMLIITGIKAGGNISTLLEQTASNMREKEFVEKRAVSNIQMYVIFIFFAVGIGAPVLFGLSSVLVEIIIKLVGNLPTVQSTQMNLPFTFNSIGLSPAFIIYFALIFLIVTDVISCLVIGLVNKGEEKAGLRYLIPILAISISIFFLIRIILTQFLAESFSAMT